MKNDEEVVGKLTRVEYQDGTGRLFLVFEIVNEKLKQTIQNNWTEDIEFKIVDKDLIQND